MKKSLLTILLFSTLSGKAQLGSISFLYYPSCGGYVGLVDYIEVTPIPGATSYHWFKGSIQNPSLRINGNLLATETPMNNPSIAFFAPQQPFYHVCVYAYNATDTTDTACVIMQGMPPQPILDPTNNYTVVPNTTGTYAVVLPNPIQCAVSTFWTITPSGSGATIISGQGNDSILINFSSTFVSCTLCVHHQTTFNLDGPDTCVVINAVTGIEENSQSLFSLFPNPFSDEINVTAKGNDFIEINFFDVTGRKVFGQLFTGPTTINTALLSKGFYIYEVRSKDKVIGKGKVVKE